MASVSKSSCAISDFPRLAGPSRTAFRRKLLFRFLALADFGVLPRNMPICTALAIGLLATRSNPKGSRLACLALSDSCNLWITSGGATSSGISSKRHRRSAAPRLTRLDRTEKAADRLMGTATGNTHHASWELSQNRPPIHTEPTIIEMPCWRRASIQPVSAPPRRCEPHLISRPRRVRGRICCETTCESGRTTSKSESQSGRPRPAGALRHKQALRRS